MTDRETERYRIGVFLRLLGEIGAEVLSVSERTEDHDTSIYLAGRYDGMHIQISTDAYYVVREVLSDSFADSGLRFTKGAGKLLEELEDHLL